MLHAFNDLAENDVLAIEPAGHNSGDEELGAVGVLTSIGHGEKTGLGVAGSWGVLLVTVVNGGDDATIITKAL